MKNGKREIKICISIYLIAANGTMKNTNKKVRNRQEGGVKEEEDVDYDYDYVY